MKKVASLIFISIGLWSCGGNGEFASSSESDVQQYVDTRIGTEKWMKKSTLSTAELPQGHVYPGVGMPFAMSQCTPQTTTGDIPYWWEHDKIQGFRSTHYPSGASMSEYGPLTIMATVGDLEEKPEERASKFSHDSEISKPYYYAVDLDDYGIKAELTAVSKAEFFQFTYPQSSSANIIIDNPLSNGYFRVIPERQEIEGYTTEAGRGGNQGYVGREFACYFVAQFSKPFDSYGIVPVAKFAKGAEYVPNGFVGEYFNNLELSGAPRATTHCDMINFEWAASPEKGVVADNFAARFTGKLMAKESGLHTFFLTSDDGSRLFVNGEKVIDMWYNHGAVTKKYEMQLTEGESYEVVIEYYDAAVSGTLKFDCAAPADTSVEQIVRMAAKGAEASSVYVNFETKDGEQVKVKIGTSFINMSQARRNLESEIGHWDFDKTKNETKSVWDQTLNKISVEASEKDKRIFYTALQRCMLLPRNMTEDGYHYSAFNGKVMPGVMYSDFSLWDTFRAQHPLLVLLQPAKVVDMINSLLNAYDEGGWMPKWPNPGYSNIMMGTHADAVVADAYIKGITGFDTEKAFESMLKNASTVGDNHYQARVGILDYNKLGFVPTDKYGESVIRTMEFAYDDYCIAQMAKALGKDEEYDDFMLRSQRYKNVLDPETKLVRGKNADGGWRSPTDASISGWAYGTERDREVYFHNITLMVPHDVDGLIEFFEGDDKFIDYLDNFFANDYYYVGDEYSMHSPYLYNYAGAPWKTQKVIRELLDYYFTDGAGGLPGNEDCGQLSSWYLFGSMGFYPVCPGSPIYQIGSPSVDRVSLNLDNGKKFTVVANNNSKENVYIQSATLNGKPYDKCYIHHDDIMNGSTIVFNMGSTPNKSWGVRK